MTQYNVFSLCLCLIVFVLLTVLFAFMLAVIIKLANTAIKCGAYDDKLLKSAKAANVKNKAFTIVKRIVSAVISAVITIAMIFSVYINASPVAPSETVPKLSVVSSSSMSYKNPKNQYLEANNLDDQFSTFDLVLIYKLPDEYDLRLYDIVVYELDGTYIIHRIVAIEEPNDKHAERWFLLQGDAVENPDRFPVRYEQMRAIYKGERFEKAGKIISFLQSPAGILCVLLTLFYIIATPLVEKRIERNAKERLNRLPTVDGQA